MGIELFLGTSLERGLDAQYSGELSRMNLALASCVSSMSSLDFPAKAQCALLKLEPESMQMMYGTVDADNYRKVVVESQGQEFVTSGMRGGTIYEPNLKPWEGAVTEISSAGFYSTSNGHSSLSDWNAY